MRQVQKQVVQKIVDTLYAHKYMQKTETLQLTYVKCVVK